jgi:hypothetical protein
MENKSMPKNLNEIKTLINDVKAFQLDEYALRLKEKKKLVKLYSDLIVCFKLLFLNSVLQSIFFTNSVYMIQKFQMNVNMILKQLKNYGKILII